MVIKLDVPIILDEAEIETKKSPITLEPLVNLAMAECSRMFDEILRKHAEELAIQTGIYDLNTVDDAMPSAIKDCAENYRFILNKMHEEKAVREERQKRQAMQEPVVSDTNQVTLKIPERESTESAA